MLKIIKDTFVLFAITLVCGLILGGIYNITAKARNNQEKIAQVQAYKSVMKSMDSYTEVKLDKNKADEYAKKSILENEKKNKITTIKPYNANVDEVVLVKDANKKDIGYIVTITDKEAYDGSLKIAVGVDKNMTVTGISFLSLSETPGLGMKADDNKFKGQFSNKKVDYFEYTKTNEKGNNKVDAISSATITSNAVTHGVNAVIEVVNYLGEENHE